MNESFDQVTFPALLLRLRSRGSVSAVLAATRWPASAATCSRQKRYEHRLSSIRDGLPVAGEAGSTLGPERGRSDDENSKCAVGKVHVKTGTLTGAIALNGLTQGKDGRRKVSSFVENGSTAKSSRQGRDGRPRRDRERLLGLTRTCAAGADARGARSV